MAQMVLAQVGEDAPAAGQVMDREMDRLIAHVHERETAEEGSNPRLAEQQPEQELQTDGQRDSDMRRHHEMPEVSGIVVMVAVSDVIEVLVQRAAQTNVIDVIE